MVVQQGVYYSATIVQMSQAAGKTSCERMLWWTPTLVSMPKRVKNAAILLFASLRAGEPQVEVAQTNMR